MAKSKPVVSPRRPPPEAPPPAAVKQFIRGVADDAGRPRRVPRGGVIERDKGLMRRFTIHLPEALAVRFVAYCEREGKQYSKAVELWIEENLDIIGS